jgi:nitroreductase
MNGNQSQRGSALLHDTALMQQLANRGTVRDFKKGPVPQSWCDAIVAHGMRAPTSSNRQEYSIIQVDDPDSRQRLSELSSDQKHIIECPVFLLFVRIKTGWSMRFRCTIPIIRLMDWKAG